ncbi:MAG TPA: SpoIIE family protein phosphatase [Opitutus sp.]|nr:SpoIIE family protein phosphatase [Opitutus sp.]
MDIETVDLRSLVGHRGALPAAMTVEDAQAEFARRNTDFLAVLDGDALLGLSARRELTQALGSRYGFALNARRPVHQHLMARPLRVSVSTPPTEVFKAASARAAREFYDDVLLVEDDGRYAGLIPMHTLVRLQTEFLLGTIARVEASRQEIAEKNRQMQEDLEMAREVQLAMLPQPDTTLAAAGTPLRLAHRYRPAGGVSGDFFAVLRLDNGGTGLLVCDVMGHGVRSALITAMVRAMVEELRPIAGDPGRLLTRLNADLTRLLRQAGSLIFVTAAYVVIEPAAARWCYAQAGHPTPLRSRAATGKVEPVACEPASAGPALGLIDDFPFAACEQPAEPGDRVLLFTDGVSEARSGAGEEFGAERVAACLARTANRPLDAALGQLLDEVTSFCGQAAFDDDICLLAAEVNPADFASKM